MFDQTSSWAVFRRTKIITRQKDNHIWQLFINTSQLNLQQSIYAKHINNKFIYKYIYKTKVLYRGGVLGWGLKSILDGEKVYARRVKAIEDSHEDHHAYKISSLLHKLLKRTNCSVWPATFAMRSIAHIYTSTFLGLFWKALERFNTLKHFMVL